MQVIARLALANCYYELGKLEQARDVLLPAQTLSVKGSVQPDALYQMAVIALQTGELLQAQTLAQEGLAAAPDSPAMQKLNETLHRAMLSHASRLDLLAALEEAVSVAKQAKDPPEAEAAYRKAAELSLALGYTEEAVAIYTELAERFPNDPSSRDAFEQCLGLLERSTDDYSRARADALRKRLNDTQPSTSPTEMGGPAKTAP
jgi:tetratricopeptide (TPR) repeat protein